MTAVTRILTNSKFHIGDVLRILDDGNFRIWKVEDIQDKSSFRESIYCIRALDRKTISDEACFLHVPTLIIDSNPSIDLA